MICLYSLMNIGVVSGENSENFSIRRKALSFAKHIWSLGNRTYHADSLDLALGKLIWFAGLFSPCSSMILPIYRCPKWQDFRACRAAGRPYKRWIRILKKSRKKRRCRRKIVAKFMVHMYIYIYIHMYTCYIHLVSVYVYIYLLMKYSLLHTPRCLWLNNRDRQTAFSGYILRDSFIPNSHTPTTPKCPHMAS